MERSSVVIEQLFENLPQDSSNAYSNNDRSGRFLDEISVRERQPAKQRKAQATRSEPQKSQQQQLSVSEPHQSSNATWTPSARHSRLSNQSSAPSSRPKSRNQSLASVADNGSIKFPISYDVALALFGTKMSPLEQIEVQNYENIYFMGLSASKIQVPKSGAVDLYDDEECYYKVVPHDQIAYRYEPLDRPILGKGTFAQVIRAYDHKERRKVAIKIIRNERIYLKQSREELRILQVLRKADSSNTHSLVHFFEFFMFRNHMCITFELLGMNLYQVLRRNQYRGLGSSKILSVAKITLKCLELLYKCRIIHCDIKPENIMLKRNGDFSTVTVGDFGSSCYEQQQVYHYVQSRFYRAPEVMLGMRYGPAIDMWSLGCVLGELSTGYPIFMGRDDSDQLAAIEEVMGSMPSDMRVSSRVKVKQSTGRGAPGSKAFSTIVSGDENFKDFVRQALEWNPVTRSSPSEMLEHQWVKSRVGGSAPKVVGSNKTHQGASGKTKQQQQNVKRPSDNSM